MTCIVDGCDKSDVSRGYCNGHYRKFLRHDGNPLWTRPKLACNVKDCNRKHSAKGYCKTHYYNVYKGIYEKRKKERFDNRIKLFEILGSICQCRGNDCWHKGKCVVNDIRIIQFDHIYGGGTKQRKELHLHDTNRLYLFYLQDLSWTKEHIRPLCANCNWMKRHTNNEIKRRISLK